MAWNAQLVGWAVVALLLFAAEAMAPGAFMLWLGIAAALVCGLVLLFPGLSMPEGSELSLFQSRAMPRSRSGSIAITPR